MRIVILILLFFTAFFVSQPPAEIQAQDQKIASQPIAQTKPINTMETKDIIASGIALGALLISLIALLYTRGQIHRAQISQRGVLFKELYQRLFDDEEMKYVYSLTENNEKIFKLPEHGASNPQEQNRRQKAIERLFAHFEVICALYKSKLLAPEDMQHFRYNIQRLSQYPDFDSYRHWLEVDWPRKQNLERGPYSSVFWYVDQN